MVADWYLLSLSEVMVGMPQPAQRPHRRGKALRARFRSASLALPCAPVGSFTSSFSWMAAFSRPLDAATLVMPDDWDDEASPDGKCDPLAWRVLSRARELSHDVQRRPGRS